MYLALLLMQIGIGMLLSVIHIVMFTVLTYLILKYFVIFPEEKYLEDKFGIYMLDIKKALIDGFNAYGGHGHELFSDQ